MGDQGEQETDTTKTRKVSKKGALAIVAAAAAVIAPAHVIPLLKHLGAKITKKKKIARLKGALAKGHARHVARKTSARVSDGTDDPHD